VGVAAYGLAYFVQATIGALPNIAEKALPAVTQWCAEHNIRLPFTNIDTLKDEVMKNVTAGAKSLGTFADFARGATAQFIYFIVGCVVAMGIFYNPDLEMDAPAKGHKNNFYSACCLEISKRVASFFESFSIIMRAQVIIAAIDAALTGIFCWAMGFSYVLVAVGMTFICGLIPMVGNLLSNTLVVGLGFMVSPTKGLVALGFLVCIHQLEYILNSRIVGGRIRSPLWMTLLSLVLGEGLMGVTGMIIAPAILHYIRIEAAEISVNHSEK
jgi:predicted PurR-regulated permease PerM